jgi:hypothetical protein
MSEVIKAFLGVFLIVLFLTASVSLLGALAEGAKAGEAIHAYARELQEGNYAMPVFRKCGKQAAENNWKLTADLKYYSGTGGRMEFSKEGEADGETDAIRPADEVAEEIKTVRLCLEYPVRLPLFGINLSRCIFCTA